MSVLPWSTLGQVLGFKQEKPDERRELAESVALKSSNLFPLILLTSSG